MTTPGDSGRGSGETHDEWRQNTLNDLRRRRRLGQADGAGPVAANSDELLDSGRDALAYFRNLIPLYNEFVGSGMSGGRPAVDLNRYERRYDEHRGFDFQAILAGLRGVAVADAEQQRVHQGFLARMDQVWEGWTGAAADAAKQAVLRVDDQVRDVHQGFRGIDVIGGEVVRRVSLSILDKVEMIVDRIGATTGVGGWTPSRIRCVIDAALKDDRDAAIRAASLIPVDIADDGACDEDTIKARVAAGAVKWLNECFVPDVLGKSEFFDSVCDTVTTNIDRDLAVLLDVINDAVSANSFKGVGKRVAGSPGDTAVPTIPGGGTTGGRSHGPGRSDGPRQPRPGHGPGIAPGPRWDPGVPDPGLSGGPLSQPRYPSPPGHPWGRPGLVPGGPEPGSGPGDGQREPPPPGPGGTPRVGHLDGGPAGVGPSRAAGHPPTGGHPSPAGPGGIAAVALFEQPGGHTRAPAAGHGGNGPGHGYTEAGPPGSGGVGLASIGNGPDTDAGPGLAGFPGGAAPPPGQGVTPTGGGGGQGGDQQRQARYVQPRNVIDPPGPQGRLDPPPVIGETPRGRPQQ